MLYLTFILIVSAYSRCFRHRHRRSRFCGYACPQTVYTEISRGSRKKFEGDRTARIKLDQAPMSFEKAWRKGGKHLVWVLIGLWTGFTFVGYFTPIKTWRTRVTDRYDRPVGDLLILFYGFATWGNAGFMREQVQAHVSLRPLPERDVDRDTMIVTYDKERGRAARRAQKSATTTKALNLDPASTVRCVQGLPDRDRHRATVCSTNASAARPASMSAIR